ncbi:MAG: bifunctional diaminohydroxyphosphoribosylaminopyrimidine deaminase/5-amino-6-(5-phosphoribosylamino)uracil reductase RibD [Proteobacteria bacterium]|nr:bifunctional diaminohydroxyphosphoribosylaminopyrimidine deaminase/5-amino-6-(5-phosphoribosylamino)uracil reductase RibD [Pseudomonadota bacterium]MYJ94587.1 bifunctional diaminohydroxyphosphoribosylaminopyrimidine deaminase/5-amino-6-(5-phosphoribosylamino)uracil reductase RibD [Pseudomonadota bacterium]
MARAVQLARRGLFSADPNPRVGCVLVKAGRIVGEGWHERAGGPHAERVAIAEAGTDASGATAYVTLEPCSHTGRTGPCADALIEARVARVVCGATDPNPLVDGTGVRRLREAGMDVTVGVLEASAAALNPGFRSRMTRGRPLIRSKLAASLDGRTALANGESQWITGEAARRDVHRWRARSSAVLTGIGTVLADDPGLDARLPAPHLPIVQPARIVVDSGLRTPPTARTLALPGTSLVFGCREAPESAEALRQAGARVESVPGARHCDLARVMTRLGELQFNEVWVEAGARLNGALLDAGLIDELVIYLAPQVLGADGRGMFAIEPLASLEDRFELEYQEVRKVGKDLRIRACLAES